MDIFGSAREWEAVDVTGGDQTPTINGNKAMGLYCDTAGTIIKFDSSKATGITVTLPAGWNPLEITKVYQTGTTVAGNAFLLAW